MLLTQRPAARSPTTLRGVRWMPPTVRGGAGLSVCLIGANSGYLHHSIVPYRQCRLCTLQKICQSRRKTGVRKQCWRLSPPSGMPPRPRPARRLHGRRFRFTVAGFAVESFVFARVREDRHPGARPIRHMVEIPTFSGSMGRPKPPNYARDPPKLRIGSLTPFFARLTSVT